MDINKIPFGEMEKFNVFVEIPQGSTNKYEVDEATGLMTLEFVFKDGLRFPYNYGFICGTRAGDGDHLDAIVLSTEPLPMGSLIGCKAIGMMEVVDRGEEDNKILCVPIVDPLAKKYSDITDLEQAQVDIFNDFLNQIAKQKNKVMETKAVHNKARAEQEIKKSLV